MEEKEREKKRAKNRNVKKLLIFLSLIASIVTIYETAKIYAVFYSESKANEGVDVARWEIIINNEDIVDLTGLDEDEIPSFEIGTLYIEDSDSTNGKLAPGLEGRFEIIIKPMTTQVSVRYDIIIDNANLIDTDVELVLVEEIAVGNTIVQTDVDTYTGVIPLANIKAGYINNIRLIYKWQDDSGSGSEYVEADENVTPVIKIPIKVIASQYLGEAIVPYI